MKFRTVFKVLLIVNLISCGNNQFESSVKNGLENTNKETLTKEEILELLLPTVGSQNSDGSIIQSRSALTLGMGLGIQAQLKENTEIFNNTRTKISIKNSPNTKVEFDDSGLKIPTPENKVLDLGSIILKNLIDNNLKVCGIEQKTKCQTAAIRIYTVGTDGPGVWNSEDGYGMPIKAGSAELVPVGLNLENAAIVQSFDIPDNKHVLRLSDFPASEYKIETDFSNAGAGNYSTTLIIEYALFP